MLYTHSPGVSTVYRLINQLFNWYYVLLNFSFLLILLSVIYYSYHDSRPNEGLDVKSSEICKIVPVFSHTPSISVSVSLESGEATHND